MIPYSKKFLFTKTLEIYIFLRCQELLKLDHFTSNCIALTIVSKSSLSKFHDYFAYSLRSYICRSMYLVVGQCKCIGIYSIFRSAKWLQANFGGSCTVRICDPLIHKRAPLPSTAIVVRQELGAQTAHKELLGNTV